MIYPNKNGARWQKQRDKLANNQQIKLEEAISEASEQYDQKIEMEVITAHLIKKLWEILEYKILDDKLCGGGKVNEMFTIAGY